MATGAYDVTQCSDFSKTGTVVPNRIFVGGISGVTSEDDLNKLFSSYGNVKESKIIFTKTGISRGYGFVTFETEEEARRIIAKTEPLILHNRKLDIAAAVKKKVFMDTLDTCLVPTDQIAWSSPAYLGYCDGAGSTQDPMYHPQAGWSCSMPHLCLQQAGQYSSDQILSPLLYPVAPTEYHSSMDLMPAHLGVPITEHVNIMKPESPEAMDSSSYVCTQQCVPSPGAFQDSGNVESPTNLFYSMQLPRLQLPVFSKTLNGVTVLSYPAHFAMPNPSLIQVGNDTDVTNAMSEYGYFHSAVASEILTPPQTPYNGDAIHNLAYRN